MSNQVIIKDAVKRYGDFTALNGVSLDIREGEFFTLLGPSGCGKTTLLRMIAGFNSIEGGEDVGAREAEAMMILIAGTFICNYNGALTGNINNNIIGYLSNLSKS